MRVRNVCVIGAGAAGLCAARRLSLANLAVTVFELASGIGGTWVYTDQTGKDSRGNAIMASMYKGLRTNLPKDVMAYPDFPYDPKLPSFITHEEVLQYLRDYAEHFELEKFIKFNHKVVSVRPVKEIEDKGNNNKKVSNGINNCDDLFNEDEKWEVVVEDQLQNATITEHFDAVVVCNGHHSEPRWAEIKDLELFKGVLMHSHEYRDPSKFVEKRVLVLGANPSGSDISLEVAEVASKVYVGHAKAPKKFPSNLVQVAFAKQCLDENRVRLTDDQVLEVDAIIFCTGYQYTYPFLSANCGVRASNNVVFPLYKHVFCIERPSLVFVGLNFRFIPNISFDLQISCAAKVFSGQVDLPSKQAMLKDTQDEIDLKLKMGWKEHHFHQLGPFLEKYYDFWAQMAQVQPMRPVVLKMFRKAEQRRAEDIANFKRDKYEALNDEDFDFIANFYDF